MSSEETAVAEVVLDDDVVDSSHHELDLARVGGASEVGIHLLDIRLVKVDELLCEELGSLFVVLSTWRK